VKSVFINSIGIIGPGIRDWSHCREILAGGEQYEKSEMPKLVPSILPANERRRTTPMIKLALHVATEAINNADISAMEVCSVFASSNSDLEIIDRICNDLMLPDHPVSPIQFHNSVHNAPAGYWSIGTGSQLPSTSLSGGLASVVAGLIEASTLALIENETVLLVIYDCPVAGLLNDATHMKEPFACAMVLTTDETTDSLAKIQMLGSTDKPCEQIKNSKLGTLCSDNMAATTLLLLEPIVENISKTVSIPYTSNRQYLVSVEPCEQGTC